MFHHHTLSFHVFLPLFHNSADMYRLNTKLWSMKGKYFVTCKNKDSLYDYFVWVLRAHIFNYVYLLSHVGFKYGYFLLTISAEFMAKCGPIVV